MGAFEYLSVESAAYIFMLSQLSLVIKLKFWLFVDKNVVAFILKIAVQFLLCYNNLKTATKLKFRLL